MHGDLYAQASGLVVMSRFLAAEPRSRRRRLTLVRVALVASASLLAALTGCASNASAPARAGTVSGVVLSAPSCPVERIGSPCPPRPVPRADVTALRGETVVAHVRADDHGRFTIRLSAGDYTIVARMVGGLGTSASAPVTVSADGVATVTLTVDSGIR